jgi:hypothetical protein
VRQYKSQLYSKPAESNQPLLFEELAEFTQGLQELATGRSGALKDTSKPNLQPDDSSNKPSTPVASKPDEASATKAVVEPVVEEPAAVAIPTPAVPEASPSPEPASSPVVEPVAVKPAEPAVAPPSPAVEEAITVATAKKVPASVPARASAPTPPVPAPAPAPVEVPAPKRIEPVNEPEPSKPFQPLKVSFVSEGLLLSEVTLSSSKQKIPLTGVSCNLLITVIRIMCIDLPHMQPCGID